MRTGGNNRESVSSALANLEAWMDHKVDRVTPFRATVLGVSDGLVSIRAQEEEEDEVGEEEYARVVGPVLAVDDEIICLRIYGTIIVLGRIQNSAPAPFVLDSNLNLYSGSDLNIYSDTGSTLKFGVDGATGVLTLSTGITIRSGSGSPEGVVTATQGSIYFRTNGGTGTTIYEKSSGSGNTGWVANAATSGGGPGTLEVQEGGTPTDSAVSYLNFDSTDFNTSSSPAGTANVSLAYGTTANTPAEGNHTHTASLVVSEGGTPVDSAVGTVNFDASDFNVSSSPSGQANVSLAYGTSANQPAEGNHTHSYGQPLTVQEGGVTTETTVDLINFDSTDFNVSNPVNNQVSVSLAYGTSAGTPAEGNHTHAASLVVSEGGTPADSAVGTLNFDATDFNVSSSPAGQANVSLAYGTSAGTPAEGNHTHAATLVVSEGGTPVDSAVGTINFDATDFNVSSSPSGQANISLAYGTSAGTPAEGNHVHAAADVTSGLFANARIATGTPDGTKFLRDDQVWAAPSASGSITVQEGDSTVDAAVTVLDFDASDFNVTSSPAGEANISLAYGTSAGTPAEGNHTHTLSNLTDTSGVISPSTAGKVLTWSGSVWDDMSIYCETLGPWYEDDVAGTATTDLRLLYFNTGTAVSKSANRIRAGRTGWIVGAKITSDAARTAGTCTVQVDISGSGTAFDAGSVVLDGTRTTQDAAIVSAASGIYISSGGDTIGVQLVTSGWTPTTANVQVTLLVIWDPVA